MMTAKVSFLVNAMHFIILEWSNHNQSGISFLYATPEGKCRPKFSFSFDTDLRDGHIKLHVCCGHSGNWSQKAGERFAKHTFCSKSLFISLLFWPLSSQNRFVHLPSCPASIHLEFPNLGHSVSFSTLYTTWRLKGVNVTD